MNTVTDYVSGYVASIHRDMLRKVGVRVVTAPTEEPLSLVEAKEHLRVTSDEPEEGIWITSMIPAAREWCENYLGISIAAKTLELATNSFPAGAIELPFGPVLSVTSVTYRDSDGAEQAYTGYQFDEFDGRILRGYQAEWPTARDTLNSIRIRYVAGYGDNSPIPASILAAMKLLLGHWYENRESSTAVKLELIPMGVTSLLNPYRLMVPMA